MQPYFIPYAGYFRLLEASDLFVIYDCVQFARRGWTHRNRLTTSGGALDWLTLPLAKAPQDVRIADLAFRDDAVQAMAVQLSRFPALAATPVEDLVAAIRETTGNPVAYIERLLRQVATQLGLRWNVVRSSSLDLDPALRGQDRILAIVSHFGATTYINPPGGRELYEPSHFASRGIALRFLEPYRGNPTSIAERLANEPPAAVTAEVRTQLHLVP